MCIACDIQLNTEKSDAFSERLLEMLNNGMTALMVSIGHRTGLFDVMADGVSRSSKALARDSKLHERYVREWLGAMVAAQIVHREPATDSHRLPPEHAHWLVRDNPTSNMAVFAQFLPVLASVEDQILDCFKNGGGVPYEAYPRFQDVMAEDSGQSVVPIMVDKIVPLIPGLHERLVTGIDVLDAGCGKGRALMQLATAYPQSRFVGYDLSEEVIAEANSVAQKNGLKNIAFVVKNLTHWNEPESFDFITALDAIHDQARPDFVLSAIKKALRPEGVFMMQDIDVSSEPVDNINHPLGATVYTVSCLHCMTVSLAQDGLGLGAAWGVQRAEQMLREAGFEDVQIHRFEHDIQNAYFVMQT